MTTIRAQGRRCRTRTCDFSRVKVRDSDADNQLLITVRLTILQINQKREQTAAVSSGEQLVESEFGPPIQARLRAKEVSK
jgi:hypothetical protein